MEITEKGVKIIIISIIIVILGPMFLMGVISIISGLVPLLYETSFKSNAVEHAATITRIEETHIGHGDNYDTDYTVYIEYSVDGRLYNKDIYVYNSDMSVGQEIKIYYNPDNPGEVIADYDLSIWPLFLGGGLIIICISIIVIIMVVKRKLKK